MKKSAAGKALEAKIASVVALTLILHSSDLQEIREHLEKIAGGHADYFDHDLSVIELAMAEDAANRLDWDGLLPLLREWNLNPVAVRNAPSALVPKLHALGLSIDEVAARPAAAASSEAAAAAEPAAAAAAPAASTEPTPAKSSAPNPGAAISPASQSACMIVDTPVRGGQRIYARGSDLVVTAIVNAGAELIADGSIHVYAPLRGRALAGAAGETGARIFALEMTPELVSIAGIYRTFEEGPPADLGKGPAEVRLAGERLDLRAIGERH